MPHASKSPTTRSNRYCTRTSWFAATILLLVSASHTRAQSVVPSPDPLVERILQPPLRNLPRIDRAWEKVLATIGARTDFATTSDGVRIAYTVIEPRDFNVRPRVTFDYDALDFNITFEAKGKPAPRVRGTVLLTHGWSLDARSVLPWAFVFGERGFRTVLVDLRGHGRSQRAPITFGAREGRDIGAVVSALGEQRRLHEPLALFGVSYGAVAAIRAAADPTLGVDALIAMEPFTNAGDAIRRMGGFAKEGGSGSWRKRLAAWWARMKISSDEFESAVDRASHSIGANLRTLDTTPVLAGVPVCTLLLQGGADTLVDVRAVRAMARATSARVVYAEAPREGHLTLPARFDWLGEPVANWLDAALAAARTRVSSENPARPGCPALNAPNDSRRRQSLDRNPVSPT